MTQADHSPEKPDPADEPPSRFRQSRSRIMDIECTADGLDGPAVIGRVYFSKSGKSLYYSGLTFQSLKGTGFKANYMEIESGDPYWISGPLKDQNDRLWGGNRDAQVDEDVRAEYAAFLSGDAPVSASRDFARDTRPERRVPPD